MDAEAVVTAFTDAVNRHDLDAVVSLMTPDAIFDGTAPPDGHWVEGEAVAEEFRRLFANAKNRHFAIEETIVAGDRATVRWRHTWVDLHGQEGHVRGVDVFRIRRGKIAEKLSYVKG